MRVEGFNRALTSTNLRSVDHGPYCELRNMVPFMSGCVLHGHNHMSSKYRG